MIVKVSKRAKPKEDFTSPIKSIGTVKILKAAESTQAVEPEPNPQEPSFREMVAARRPAVNRAQALAAFALLFVQ